MSFRITVPARFSAGLLLVAAAVAGGLVAGTRAG